LQSEKKEKLDHLFDSFSYLRVDFVELLVYTRTKVGDTDQNTESILSLEKINVGGNRKEFSQLPLSECLRRITARLTPSPFPHLSFFPSLSHFSFFSWKKKQAQLQLES